MGKKHDGMTAQFLIDLKLLTQLCRVYPDSLYNTGRLDMLRSVETLFKKAFNLDEKN